MNNITDDSEYTFMQLKDIVLKQKTYIDAINIINSYNINIETHNKLMSFINGFIYPVSFDFNTMITHMKSLNNMKYTDDVYNEINHIIKNTSDNAQIKTLIRIANSKQHKPNQENEQYSNINTFIKKKCPHCSHMCSSDISTMHIICGYHDNSHGYDWKGCGKDWCFTCGKKLCKKWFANNLFQFSNRFHNSKCCKNHAVRNNYAYPDDYCMCQNLFVLRH